MLNLGGTYSLTPTLRLRTVCAAAIIAKDTRIVSELIAKYPHLGARANELAPLLASIAGPEYSLKNAIVLDSRAHLHHLNSLPAQLATAAMSKSGIRSLEHLQFQFQFKQNAALNLQYDMTTLSASIADASAPEITHVFQSTKEMKNARMGLCVTKNLCLRNPIAKILIEVGDVLPVHYVQRQWDVEGYLRLVTLQLTMTQQQIPPEKIPAFLASAAPELRNPYTQQAMTWNAEKRTLAFEGREESRAISTRPKTEFIANVPA